MSLLKFLHLGRLGSKLTSWLAATAAFSSGAKKRKRLKWVHMAHNNWQQRCVASLVLQLQSVFQCAVELVRYSQQSKYCQEQLHLWIYLFMSWKRRRTAVWFQMLWDEAKVNLTWTVQISICIQNQRSCVSLIYSSKIKKMLYCILWVGSRIFHRSTSRS